MSLFNDATSKINFGSTYFGSGSGVSGNPSDYKPSPNQKWGEAFSAASEYLSKSKKKEEDEDKYRNQVAIGNAMQASTSQGPDQYTKIYTPAQQAPVYIQGVEGKPGFGGIAGQLIGGLAGGLLGGPAGVGLGAQLGGAIGGSF